MRYRCTSREHWANSTCPLGCSNAWRMPPDVAMHRGRNSTLGWLHARQSDLGTLELPSLTHWRPNWTLCLNPGRCGMTSRRRHFRSVRVRNQCRVRGHPQRPPRAPEIRARLWHASCTVWLWSGWSRAPVQSEISGLLPACLKPAKHLFIHGFGCSIIRQSLHLPGADRPQS